MKVKRSTKFDPCSIFPARVRDRKFEASPASGKGGITGATSLSKGKVIIPTWDSAYYRTVRLHEALHAIYTSPDWPCETMLDQALEDARLHLVCAKTEGTVRRDEVRTALDDIRGGAEGNKELAALLALRSAAIFASHEDKMDASTVKRFTKLCAQVAPDYSEKVMLALAQIEHNHIDAARATLQPYFGECPKSDETFRNGKGKSDTPNGKSESDSPVSAGEVTFDKLDGKLSTDAVDMISPAMVQEIAKAKDGEMPKLTIVPLFASQNVKTFVGEDFKRTISGTKISAKRLATIVGPCTPRIFKKTIHRQGGTVLIDASGSMDITPDQLLKLCESAPLATIGFYNAIDDEHLEGTLWIFAHKGKRAEDFSEVQFVDKIPYEDYPKTKTGQISLGPLHGPYYGSGNVVDFQALQWLLEMPAPRWVLTDGGFTGPPTTCFAATELLYNGIARKKWTQVRSLSEMQAILDRGGRTIE